MLASLFVSAEQKETDAPPLLETPRPKTPALEAKDKLMAISAALADLFISRGSSP